MLVRSVDYGEADRIVTLLTEHTGLVALMARSARKSQRRFAGALEPFGVIDAELALGRGEVGRLASARLVRGFPTLLGSLPAMREAGRALELVRDATPPRESDPRLLATVEHLFERLAAEAAHAGALRARSRPDALGPLRRRRRGDRVPRLRRRARALARAPARPHVGGDQGSLG